MRRMKIRYAAPVLAAAAAVVPVTLAIAASSGAPPAVTASPTASSVSDSGATLSGTVDPNGLATKYAFQYGTSHELGQQTTLTSAGDGTSAIDETATLSGLAAGTSYRYRVIAINADGTAVSSPVYTFVTSGTPTASTEPDASTGAVDDITATGAKVSGTVDPNGTATTYQFEYGPTDDYGYETAAASAGSGTTSVSESSTLTGLTPGTIYHYAIVATTDGHTVVGDDGTFTTETESQVRLIGHEGFVSPGNVIGAEVICVNGMTACDGTVTLSYDGKTIASGKLVRKAESGGFENVKLNSTGATDLAKDRAKHKLLPTTVKVVLSNGQTVTGAINLARWYY